MDCLRGDLSLRELRMRIENLPPDRVLQEALGGTRWVDEDWFLYDIANHVRLLGTLFYNANRGKNPPIEHQRLPGPDEITTDEVTVEQLAAESELSALMHRER